MISSADLPEERGETIAERGSRLRSPLLIASGYRPGTRVRPAGPAALASREREGWCAELFERR